MLWLWEINNINIVDQLIRIYYEEETWDKEKLSEEKVREYFSNLLKRGNLAYCLDKEGEICGYTEWFCISQDQYERLKNKGEIHIGEEDITSGEICWVNDVWVDPRYRDGKVFNELKRTLFNNTKHCKVYAGEEQKRKKMRFYKRRDHGK